METITDEDSGILGARAMAAYFRSHKTSRPPSGSAILFHTADHDGKRYVVLVSDVQGVMAVYRVRVDGQLKELRRWPSEVASKVAQP